MMHKELSILLKAVQAAGKAVVKFNKADLLVKKKSPNDLVTAADLLANDILKSHLLSAFPQDAWLSEETIDDFSRLNRQRVWIVDPIDGTKEFVTNVPEYAISVALVEANEPLVSAVFNPAKNDMVYAVKDAGTWKNGIRVYCNHSLPKKLLLLASRSEYQRGEWIKFEAFHSVKPIGSIAYKLALLASGQAHATFSLGEKSLWDIAAGILLVQEAGGMVTNRLGEKISFQSSSVIINGILAATQLAYEEVFSLIKDN